MSDNKQEKSDAAREISYEPPRLVPIGNLNNLLAQNIISPNCDNDLGGGAGSGHDAC
jgi:hypothetical protein